MNWKEPSSSLSAMPEELPAVSISSNPSLNPDEMPKRTFPAARKGVDGQAVRRYLEAVADDVRALLERETQLRRRLTEAERKAAEPPILDEATLNRAVGAETARVLQSAHDAAREVVARAEARAAEVLTEAEAQAADRGAIAEEESTSLVAAAAEEAATTRAGAQAEANALRAGAEAEAAAIIEAAREDAVSLLDTTKQRCRQTVRHARQLRSSVLSDLVERRRALFVQLEQLRSGRDSLVEVVATVEATVEELKSRLAGAEHGARVAAAEAGDRAEMLVDDEVETLLEPDIDLEIQSELLGADLGTEGEGELRASVRAASVAADTEALVDLAEEALTEDDDERAHEVQVRDTAASHRSVGELFARIRAARGSEVPAASEAASPTPAPEAGRGPGAEAPAEVTAEATSGPEAVEAEAVNNEPDTAETEVAAQAGITAETAVEEPGPAMTAPEREPGDGAVGQGPSPDESSEVIVADAADEAVGGEGDADVDAVVRERRDELLEPVLTRLSRALKRALQDVQNELLNALRHASGTPDLALLLPEEPQRERYALAASGALADSWLVGRGWLRPDEKGDARLDDGEISQKATETGRLLGLDLSRELSGLLRHRLSESLRTLGEIGEGAQDAAGAAYREWKGPRVEGIAGDFATRAFAAGAVAAGEGIIVRWVVDDGKPCPDCDDNALAGEQRAGDAWPTGQVYPPVHPGCRCLLVATTE